jgi:hypothetical protein
MSSGPIRLKHAQAMGSKSMGYGEMSTSGPGRNPGYASGGHVKHHKDTRAGHHSGHGAKVGKAMGVGQGGASSGPKQATGASSGPSKNQFGEGMPGGKGSSLGRW